MNTDVVSLGCTSDQCTPSASVLCTMVANTNQVLGCYVGVYSETGFIGIFVRKICPPVFSGNTYASAAYCKVK